MYKGTIGKGKQQGETEFPYKNFPPKRKDKTIKNRKLIHNDTSRDTKRKKKQPKFSGFCFVFFLSFSFPFSLINYLDIK